MKIVIDPGHGGHETGAINYTDGIMEKDINLKTARYLREYYKNHYAKRRYEFNLHNKIK